jgi:hypothetical protein
MIFIKNNSEFNQIEFHICNNQLKGNVKIEYRSEITHHLTKNESCLFYQRIFNHIILR